MDDLQDTIDYLKLEGQHKKAARLEAIREKLEQAELVTTYARKEREAKKLHASR